MKDKRCSRDQATDVWRSIRSPGFGPGFEPSPGCGPGFEPGFEPGSGIQVEHHQFPQHRPTPVCTFSVLLQILALVPGSTGARIRAAQAELSTRSVEGVNQTRAPSKAADNKESNPVMNNALMRLTPENVKFYDIRTTACSRPSTP
jgi:hypothetical protein